MLSYLWSLILYVLPLPPLPFPPGPRTDPLPVVTHDYVEALRERWGIQGVGLAIMTGPKFESRDWEGISLGLGISGTGGPAADYDSLFPIGSNSKLFAALAVGILIEEGTEDATGEPLTWTTRIKDVLPEFELMDTYASEHVTLEDFLSMRSGMPRHDYAHRYIPLEDIVMNMRNIKPSTDIRQRWQYNNQHYLTIALVVERLSNRTFIDFVTERIIQPLKLGATYSSVDAANEGRRTEGFFRHGVDMAECRRLWGRGIPKACVGAPVGINWWTDQDDTNIAGAGGVIMSAQDMMHWLQELLDPQILPPSAVLRCRTPLSVMNGSPPKYPELSVAAYGFGQMVSHYRGHQVVWHTGGIPGHMSRILRLPDRDIGVGIATSDDLWGSTFHEVASYRILDDLLHLEPIDWEQRLFEDLIHGPLSDVQPPKHPRDGPSLNGTYYHPTYGHLNFTHVPPSDPVLALVGGFTRDKPVPPLHTNGPIYVAHYNALFASHIIITPFDGVLCNWTIINVKATRFGPAASMGDFGPCVGTAEGLGMFGNFWGAGPMVPPKEAEETHVKDSAEVWFERI